MAEDYTSLLGRSDQSWSDVASILLTEEKSKSKKGRRRQKRALIGGLLLSAWDSSKINKVVKNLQDADVDKQYDIAEATQKWDNYNEFITNDKQFILAGGEPKEKDEVNEYFKSLGAVSFHGANPNFEELYKNRVNRNAEREEQINKIALALQKDHIQKRADLVAMGAIKSTIGKSPIYKTKEEFLKPYEDYYRAKKRRASDPTELSAVHSIFGVVGPSRRRRKELDEKLESYKQMMTSYSKYDTLLDIPNYAYPKAYYNPNDIGYTESDILRLVETTVENDSLQRLLVGKARKMIATNGVMTTYNTAQNNKTISDSQLQALLITTTVDFEKATVQAKQYQAEFGDLWKVRRKETELPFTVEEITDEENKVISSKRTPTNEDKFKLYEAEEDVYISQKLGLYDQNTVDLQNALLGKDYEETINVTIDSDTQEKIPNNPELIEMYDKIILDSTTSSATIMASRDWIRFLMEPEALFKLRDVLTNVYQIPKADVDNMDTTELQTWYMAITMEGIASRKSILETQEKLQNINKK